MISDFSICYVLVLEHSAGDTIVVGVTRSEDKAKDHLKSVDLLPGYYADYRITEII